MQPPPTTRFRRGSDRIVGGVCSGLGEGLHVDVIWVRLAFVVLAFVQGIGLLIYIVLWVVMPEPAGSKTAATSGWDSVSADLRRAWTEVRGLFGGPMAVSPPGATPADATPGQSAGAGTHNQSLVLGLALVLIGLVILANNVGLVRWDVIWPAVLIAFGIVLLARNVT